MKHGVSQCSEPIGGGEGRKSRLLFIFQNKSAINIKNPYLQRRGQSRRERGDTLK